MVLLGGKWNNAHAILSPGIEYALKSLLLSTIGLPIFSHLSNWYGCGTIYHFFISLLHVAP